MAWAIRAYHLQVYQYLSEIGGSRPTFFFAQRTDAILSAISMIMKAMDRMPDRRVVRPLTARILRSFLAVLEHSHHPIYALWEHVSVLSFSIKNADGEYLSLREFFGRGDAVAPDDPLVVIFHKVHIETAEELTAEYIERIYESFLYHHCEMGLRRSSPFDTGIDTTIRLDRSRRRPCRRPSRSPERNDPSETPAAIRRTQSAGLCS